MISDNPKRKLSVVLFADIAGYTAMMQQNESNALAIIHKFNEVLERVTPDYQGQVIQYYGDGCLLIFESCTQGVRCGLVLQETFNKDLKVPVRIGIHLGDVIFENENAYGDGVNIASRIQSLGTSGSILLSKPVRNQIKNKKEFSQVSLGHFEFKNVTDPIELYALSNPGISIPDKSQLTGILKPSKSGTYLKWLMAIIGFTILGIAGYKSLEPEDNSITYGAQFPTLNKPGESYLLTIGVDNNPDWLRLNNAKNDALGFRDVLKNNYGFKDLQEPLINEAATNNSIQDALENARDVLNKNDELIIFFAGHGYSDIIDEGKELPTGYIIPYDAPSENAYTFDKYIKIKDFLNEISDLPAIHISTIFDACYSGFAMGNDLLVSRGSGIDLDRASRTKSRKVFSSATYDQVAVDNGPIAGHSLFTGILIEALSTAQADNNSDGMISMNELAIYLEKNIYDYSPKEQTPMYGFHSSDKGGEMFLLYNPEELSVEKTRSDIIKNEKEIYTALPFRTSTPDDLTDMFSIYLPRNILDALSEYEKGKYKVIDLGLIGYSDSSFINTPHSHFIERSEATKYFAGTYNVFGNRMTIKICIYDAKDNSIIFSFPDIVGVIENDADKEKLAFAVKKRIKGFMDNNQQVMDRITNPPNYEAYKQLKSAYDVWCDDREKAQEYMDKAIENDPKYFRAYLAKAVSYVLCSRVNVGKAIEEWEKFKDIDFELTYYEEERFKNLEYELRGDYQKLVGPKHELFKEFQTKNTFKDALWHAYTTRNIGLSKEIIKIAENSNLGPDLKNYIFIRKNILEQFMEPIQEPILYDRFKKEDQLIKESGRNSIVLYYSKILFDCGPKCLSEALEILAVHDLGIDNLIDLIQNGGDIISYKGLEEMSNRFYQQAYKLLNEKEDYPIRKEIILEYKLNNFEKVISLGEAHLDSLIEERRFSALRYYILAKDKLNQSFENRDELLDYIRNYENFPGFGHYYLATIKCSEGNFAKANELLKMAMENGVGHRTYLYNFDPDLRNMWDDQEFKRITRLKI